MALVLLWPYDERQGKIVTEHRENGLLYDRSRSRYLDQSANLAGNIGEELASQSVGRPPASESAKSSIGLLVAASELATRH